MIIQSILFDRSIFTLALAKKWLVAHGFKTDVDTKPKHFRFRQMPPNKKYKYATKTIAAGIQIIIAS